MSPGLAVGDRPGRRGRRPRVRAAHRPDVHRTSPPLAQLLPLFKLGLGARLGDGRQYFPMVSLRDWLDGVAFLVEHDTASGPFNLCCPHTPTNARVHRRPGPGRRTARARLAAPPFVLEKAAGRLANELLGSVRSEPAALVAAGFTFQDEDVRDVIAAGAHRLTRLRSPAPSATSPRRAPA